MYLSKQSDDQRPRTLISQGGKFADLAVTVVAAPMRNKFTRVQTPLTDKEPCFPCYFSRVRNAKDCRSKGVLSPKIGGLEFKYVTMTEMGIKDECAFLISYGLSLPNRVCS